MTNGCFDLLHLGHVTYLETARNLGDALLVGVNSDAAVRGLKGEGSPLNNESDRAAVIAALRAVNYVCIFPDVRATEFLAAAKPDIYVKGGDYTLDTLEQTGTAHCGKKRGKDSSDSVCSGKEHHRAFAEDFRESRREIGRAA